MKCRLLLATVFATLFIGHVAHAGPCDDLLDPTKVLIRTLDRKVVAVTPGGTEHHVEQALFLVREFIIEAVRKYGMINPITGDLDYIVRFPMDEATFVKELGIGTPRLGGELKNRFKIESFDPEVIETATQFFKILGPNNGFINVRPSIELFFEHQSDVMNFVRSALTYRFEGKHDDPNLMLFLRKPVGVRR